MSKPTKTLLGEKARKAILDGVNAIYEPVRLTLGPQAKKALLYRTFNRGSRIVDDGKTIADCQEPRDPAVRLAAEAFKEACKKTDLIVGDGTTATTVIAGHLYNDVHRILSTSVSDFVQKKQSNEGKAGVMTIRKMILDSAKKVKDEIRATAKKIETIEELEKIATVSLGDAELGKVVAKMAWEVGLDGFIDVVEGFKGEIETEVINGFRFAAKVPGKAFVNNPNRYEMVLNDYHVLVTNHALDNASDIARTLQTLNAGTSKIAILAPSFSENVLVQMVQAIKQGFFVFPVHVPSLRTEQFEDFAVYTDSKFIDKAKGMSLRNVTFKDLGMFEKLVVKDTEAREDAIVTGGRGAILQTNGTEIDSPVKKRIDVLKGQLAETKQDNFKKLLERRIASMASSVGIIRVGDTTQASSLFLKLKIEDAVYACKAALRGGYVRGGGLCLKEIAENILYENDILRDSLIAPYNQIQSSVDGGVEIGDDIIDPADAMYYAVEHATGVVANLATVEIITPEGDEMAHGEGELAIARAINEFVLADKIHKGQITESESLMERDRLNGHTIDEAQYFAEKE